MRLLFAMIATFFFTAGSYAAPTIFTGSTREGKNCSITIYSETNISFQTAGMAGFGFLVDKNLICNAIRSGENPVVISGGDGAVSAKLAIEFDKSARPVRATYIQRNFLLPQKTVCENLSTFRSIQQ